MYRKILTNVLLTIFGLACALGTEVDHCVSGTGEVLPQPVYVDIEGCVKPPCSLVTGKNVTGWVIFTATERIEKLKIDVTGYLEGSEISFLYPLPDNDVCNGLTNTNCPLDVKDVAVYKLTTRIPKYIGQMNVRLQVSIKHNGGNNQLLCFSVNCRIVW